MTDNVNPRLDGAGFVTNLSRYANRALTGAAGIAETFLVNTRQHPHQTETYASAIEYFTAALGPVIACSGTETDDAADVVALPDPVDPGIGFGALLGRRKSTRVFSGAPMSARDLATILHAAAGTTHEGIWSATDRPASHRRLFRGVPSSGGLYAVDCYCLALNVDTLEPAAYHYRPYTHELGAVHPVQDRSELLGPFWAEGAGGIDYDNVAAILVLTGNPSKVIRKYGDRGARYMLLEAGMTAFCANLAATALGWGTLDYQAFFDLEMERCLALRGGQNHVLHTLLLG